MIDEIINCDCVEGMKQIPDKSIDMIITSPPYDDLRSYGGFNFDFIATAKEITRILKEGGVCVWIVCDQVIKGSESLSSFKQAIGFVECGLRLHDTMIWEKDTFSFPDKKRYRSCFEYMFVFSKGTPKTFNPINDRKNRYVGAKVHGTYNLKDGTKVKRNYHTEISDYGMRFNVWHTPTEKQNRTGHPAPFPIKLIEDHILSWSNEKDVILDPFMGSGTTAIACINTNRHYIGFEICEEYVNISKDRIDKTLSEAKEKRAEE